MAALRECGRLTVLAGKIAEAHPVEGGVAIRWRPRGGTAVQTMTAQRVVNCTGPLLDIARSKDPLVAALVAQGTIRPDPLHIGIATDPAGRTIGAGGDASDRLWAIGPMTRPALWEIVAVPDIRVQAQRMAALLAP
jgi:uncharacterized NAD(P)/FAD-binding protein YdhS